MTKSILTTQEVAAIFAVTPSTVVKWADSGHLPHFRTPGRHRRFYRADVEALRAGQPAPAPEVRSTA